MVSSFEVTQSNAICKSEKEIFEKLKEHLQRGEYWRAKDVYLKFLENRVMYYANSMAHIDALRNNVNALNRKKINPYIAGAAAGVGAGIVSDVRNKAIDNARSLSSQQVTEATISTNFYEKQFIETMNEFLKYVYKVPDANAIYQEALDKEVEMEVKANPPKAPKTEAQKVRENVSFVLSGLILMAIIVAIVLSGSFFIPFVVGLLVFGIVACIFNDDSSNKK